MTSLSLNTEQLERLRSLFAEYSGGSHYRRNALLMRDHVHASIRNMMAEDELSRLSLDDFDRHIWQLGSIHVRGESFDWHHADRFLAETDPGQMQSMIEAGEIRFSGNVTWGSAARTLRAYARGRPKAEMEAGMRRALATLLHETGPIERRLHQVSGMRIGFGRNICSGLLMVWQPREYILYNTVSEQFWDQLGLNVSAGSDWVRSYLRYNGFCRVLLQDAELGLQNLFDLDVFFYWSTSAQPAPLPSRPAKSRSKRKPKSVARRLGVSLAQLQATKRDMSPEQFRAVWGDLYDQLLAEERAKTITDVTQAALGQRAQRKVDRIRAFLGGKQALRPKSQVICGWIDLCYELELYREAACLLQYVLEDEVDPPLYRRTKRLAEASRARLGW